jgi:hypothetical protein
MPDRALLLSEHLPLQLGPAVAFDPALANAHGTKEPKGAGFEPKAEPSRDELRRTTLSLE